MSLSLLWASRGRRPWWGQHHICFALLLTRTVVSFRHCLIVISLQNRKGALSIFLSLTCGDWCPPSVGPLPKYIVSEENDHDIFSQKAPFHRAEAVDTVPFPSSCSHSPLHCLLKAGKPFHTMPLHSLQTQWAFLIQAKDSYLSNSIHPSALYFTPISLEILPKDIWVQSIWPVFSFSQSVFVTVFHWLLYLGVCILGKK